MQQRGATLTELMIMMGLAGLLLAFAAESFRAMASRQQGHAVAAELAGELRAARFLAIARRERVRVVIDPESRRVRAESADTTGAVLRQYDYQGRGIFMEGPRDQTPVMFYPSGRAATPATITLRNARNERWQLTVSLIGRVSIKQQSDA